MANYEEAIYAFALFVVSTLVIRRQMARPRELFEATQFGMICMLISKVFILSAVSYVSMVLTLKTAAYAITATVQPGMLLRDTLWLYDVFVSIVSAPRDSIKREIDACADVDYWERCHLPVLDGPIYRALGIEAAEANSYCRNLGRVFTIPHLPCPELPPMPDIATYASHAFDGISRGVFYASSAAVVHSHMVTSMVITGVSVFAAVTAGITIVYCIARITRTRVIITDTDEIRLPVAADLTLYHSANPEVVLAQALDDLMLAIREQKGQDYSIAVHGANHRFANHTCHDPDLMPQEHATECRVPCALRPNTRVIYQYDRVLSDSQLIDLSINGAYVIGRQFRGDDGEADVHYEHDGDDRPEIKHVESTVVRVGSTLQVTTGDRVTSYPDRYLEDGKSLTDGHRAVRVRMVQNTENLFVAFLAPEKGILSTPEALCRTVTNRAGAIYHSTMHGPVVVGSTRIDGTDHVCYVSGDRVLTRIPTAVIMDCATAVHLMDRSKPTYSTSVSQLTRAKIQSHCNGGQGPLAYLDVAVQHVMAVADRMVTTRTFYSALRGDPTEYGYIRRLWYHFLCMFNATSLDVIHRFLRTRSSSTVYRRMVSWVFCTTKYGPTCNVVLAPVYSIAHEMRNAQPAHPIMFDRFPGRVAADFAGADRGAHDDARQDPLQRDNGVGNQGAQQGAARPPGAFGPNAYGVRAPRVLPPPPEPDAPGWGPPHDGELPPAYEFEAGDVHAGAGDAEAHERAEGVELAEGLHREEDLPDPEPERAPEDHDPYVNPPPFDRDNPDLQPYTRLLNGGRTLTVDRAPGSLHIHNEDAHTNLVLNHRVDDVFRNAAELTRFLLVLLHYAPERIAGAGARARYMRVYHDLIQCASGMLLAGTEQAVLDLAARHRGLGIHVHRGANPDVGNAYAFRVRDVVIAVPTEETRAAQGGRRDPQPAGGAGRQREDREELSEDGSDAEDWGSAEHLPAFGRFPRGARAGNQRDRARAGRRPLPRQGRRPGQARY